MARTQNPIIGRTRGQAGGMVFATVNGENVMRARPASYRDANSPAQQENRAIQSGIAKALGMIKAVLAALFLKYPAGMPPYSKVISQIRAKIKEIGLINAAAITPVRLGSWTDSNLSLDTDTVQASGAASVICSLSDNPQIVDDEPELELVVINCTKGLAYRETADFVNGTATITVSDKWNVNAEDIIMYHTGCKFKAGADLSKSVK